MLSRARLLAAFTVSMAVMTHTIAAPPLRIERQQDSDKPSRETYYDAGDDQQHDGPHHHLTTGCTAIHADPSDPQARALYGLDSTLQMAVPFNTTTLHDNGPVDNRVDIVFVGDGYTVADLPDYEQHVNNILAGFFAENPFDAYEPYFNVHRVDVISNESGVDEEGGPLRDTALDMYYSNGRRLLINIGKARDAASNAPDEDQILALANSTTYGGVAWYTLEIGTVVGNHSLSKEVALHEFGHSFGNLADEYVDSSSPYTGSDPWLANVSIYTAAEQTSLQTKWYRWLDLPNVDTFEGAYYRATGIYRPTVSSKMRSLNRPFEEVNAEQFIIVLYQDVSPIDAATPSSSEPYFAGTTFNVTPMQPVGHSLDVQWFIDGLPVSGANGASFTPDYDNLSDTIHDVSVTVVDNTTRVRDETARAQWMTATRSWTVQGGYPGAPTGLIATADADSINVTWNANPEPDIVEYRVYRATSPGGTYTQVGTSTTTSYDDTTVTLGTTYYYVVSAFAQGNESTVSNEDLGTAGVVFPIAPQNLATTIDETALSIDWDDNPESNIVGYKLFRSLTTGGPYTQVHSGLLSSSDFYDTGLVNDTTYYYVVLARDANGNEGVLSGEVSGTPTNFPPSAPTGLTAEPHDRHVILSWSQNPEPDFNSYYIYYSLTSGGPYEEIDNDDVTSWYVGGLTNGVTYYFVIQAEDTSGALSPFSAEVSAIPFDDNPPSEPDNLTGVAGFETVSLFWEAVNEPDVLEYNVYRSLSSSPPYTLIGTTEDPEYLDTGLTNEVTYFYQVTTLDDAGNESDYSSGIFVTPTADPAPNPPTGVVAMAGDGSVSLDWADSGESDLDFYTVYRGTANGGPYTLIDDAFTSDYVDNNVTNGTWYYYVITATDLGGSESAYSVQVQALPRDMVPPAAPTNLQATALDSQVYLTWDANTEPDFNSYFIYIAETQGGPYDEIDSDDVTEWLVTGLTNGVTYYFVVQAEDNWGNLSPYSNEVSAVPSSTPEPLPPTNLQVLVEGDEYVFLDWDDSTQPSVTSYNTYRSTTSGGPYSYVGSDVLSEYEDDTVVNGTRYYYVVTAVDNLARESGFSNEVFADPEQPMPQPQNVSATGGQGQVTINWSPVSHPELIGYGVYRATSSGGPYTGIAQVYDPPHVDTNVVIGQPYFYVVVSINGGTQEESAYSLEVTATPVDTIPPAAPTNLVGTPTNGGVDLSWDANSEPDFREYGIYRSTTSGGPYVNIDNDDATSYADGGLVNGTTYHYVVTAFDDFGNESPNSNEVAVTPFDPNAMSGYSVQSGRVEVTGASLDVPINTVDLNHAFAMISYGTGYTNGNTNADRAMVRGYLLDGSTVRIERQNSGNSTWVSWQVVECVGDEFTAYHGNGSFSNGQGSRADNIGGVVDAGNAIAFVSADTNSGSRSYYNEAQLTAHVETSTSVRIQRAASNNSSVNYNWTVVEFDPSKIGSVQHGTISFSGPRQNAPAAASINPIDPASSILLFQSRSTQNGLAYAAIAGRLVGSDTVEFYQHTGSSGTRTVEYHVIDFGSGGAAQRGQINNASNSSWSTANASLAPIDPARTLIFQSMTCGGTGRAFPRPFATGVLTSSSNLQIQRMRWGQPSYLEWQVVQLPAAGQ